MIILVITVGVISEPEFAENIIDFNKADFVSVDRELIAYPEWLEKAKEGWFDEVRRCISCNIGCIVGQVFSHRRLRCTVNPTVGDDVLHGTIEKSNVKKKVLIMGREPAGMEIAIAVAKRGHDVTLSEKELELGGQIKIAAVAPGKSKIIEYMNGVKKVK